MSARKTRVLLFDIDGTVMLSGEAGRRALEIAFDCVHEKPAAGRSVFFDGKTDPAIYEEICSSLGIRSTGESRRRFFEKYLFALKRLAPLAPGARELPGVRDLLQAASLEGMPTGLLTGNIREGARVKLDRFGLWEFFGFGAFGDEAETRREIAALALKRGIAASGDPGLLPRDFVVIGDTPHDIDCGRAGGMRTIAVATGQRYGIEELKSFGADLAVADLSDCKTIMEWIRG
jgi:phosphoglycolate phosphatase-like HAD superfamily hydrolase